MKHSEHLSTNSSAEQEGIEMKTYYTILKSPHVGLEPTTRVV